MVNKKPNFILDNSYLSANGSIKIKDQGNVIRKILKLNDTDPLNTIIKSPHQTGGLMNGVVHRE